MPRKREDMIIETRAKLIASGRRAFATKGYAQASMDELTAEGGLTRGALYHHFGDKRGLLRAVIEQIDMEMTMRLLVVAERADTLWQSFLDECVAYIEMALEPEIQRIVLLDGPAVLGDMSQWPSQNACVRNTTRSIQRLIDEGSIRAVDADVMGRLISGAALSASLWIAGADDPRAASRRAVASFRVLLSALLHEKRQADGSGLS